MVGYIYAPASSDVNDFSVAALFSIDITPKSWQESFQANILGLIALIDVSTPHLMKNFATASIVVISSLAGFEAIYHAVAGPYTTIKRAQATLAKDYARKLGPLGVRINTVVPGAVETTGRTLPDGTREPGGFEMARREKPEYIASILKSIPLGRPGTVEEIANAVIFLSSPLSSYISGVNLVVDGSMSIGF